VPHCAISKETVVLSSNDHIVKGYTKEMTTYKIRNEEERGDNGGNEVKVERSDREMW
jgi:hypothetical protein